MRKKRERRGKKRRNAAAAPPAAVLVTFVPPRMFPAVPQGPLIAAVRLSYVVTGEWVFVRMLSLKGQETKCSLLVKFEIQDA